MKKKLSGIGILFMLLIKHPPLPDFSMFTRTPIVESRICSIRRIALGFFMN